MNPLANVNYDDMEGQAGNYPPVVPGRVAHIDADFPCYIVTAETVAEREGKKKPKTWETMVEAMHEIANEQARLCGASDYVLHVTPSGTNKGNREDQVVLLPYQGNRDGRDKPEHLDRMRGYVGEEMRSVVHLEQEADDGLAQANVRAINAGERDKSVIYSRDKDLRMVPGLHYCFDTEKVVDVDGFGWQYIVDPGRNAAGKQKPKKYMGYGTCFFWMQCLMGDTADNISGLPLAHGETLADFGIGKSGQKHRKVGPALAYKLIEKCKNDVEAFNMVVRLWLTSPADMVHHKTQLPVTKMEALLGDMRALWMRRYEGEDVGDFLAEIQAAAAKTV